MYNCNVFIAGSPVRLVNIGLEHVVLHTLELQINIVLPCNTKPPGFYCIAVIPNQGY